MKCSFDVCFSEEEMATGIWICQVFGRNFRSEKVELGRLKTEVWRSVQGASELDEIGNKDGRFDWYLGVA